MDSTHPDTQGIHYAAALISRIQPIMIGFLGMVALFWSGNRASGSAVFAISLLLFAFYAAYWFPILFEVLRIDQFYKRLKVCGLAYGSAPIALAAVLLLNENNVHILRSISAAGRDSRYLALVILFALISGYALLGVMLSKSLRENLREVSGLTAVWAPGTFEQCYLSDKLCAVQRSAHAIAVITIGITIGFLPSAFQLPDAIGMIIGVGLVALISYLDAELSSRHMA